MNTSARGFTLIEMLLVLSMTALMMLAIGGTLRTMAQSEDRVVQRIDRNDQIRVTHQFLQQILGRVDISEPVGGRADAERPFLFTARPHSIEWVGVMPARHGAAGRFDFRLAVEARQTDFDLVLRYAPHEGKATFPDWSAAEQQVLVRSVREFQLESKGTPYAAETVAQKDGIGWQSEWKSKTDIPQQLRIGIKDEIGAWSPITVALFPTLQSREGGSGFVVGGKAR